MSLVQLEKFIILASWPAAMAANGGEDGLLLNLAVAQAPAPHLSRTQQRKQKWTQQRAAKASALQRSGVAHVLERALLRCLRPPSTRENVRMHLAYAGQGRRHARSCRRSCRRPLLPTSFLTALAPRSHQPAEASPQAWRRRWRWRERPAELAGRRPAAAGARGADRRRWAAEGLLPRR